MSEESKKERGNFSPWLWATALAPMAVCGAAMVVLFSFNIVSLKQNTQQKSLTSTHARLTSNAVALTSGARYKVTAQAGAQTATALIQSFSDGAHYPIILSDAFDTNRKNWLSGTFSENNNKATLAIEDGKYLWHLNANNINFIQVAALETSPASKFYLSIETRLLSGSSTVNYGLVFHKTGNDFYYAGIDSGQNLRILLKQNNQWRTLVAPKRNFIIRGNDVNRLAVIGDGPNYLFYINGQFVERITDIQLSGNEFGIGTQIAASGENATLEFDDFELRVPTDTGLPTSTPNPTNTLIPTIVRTTPRTVTPTATQRNP